MTPWYRHSAAMRASWMAPPCVRAGDATADSRSRYPSPSDSITTWGRSTSACIWDKACSTGVGVLKMRGWVTTEMNSCMQGQGMAQADRPSAKAYSAARAGW